MFKQITRLSILFVLILPGLVLAETFASPQITIVSPSSIQAIELNSTTKLSINYDFNRSQGLFNIDLYKSDCLKTAKNLCDWSIARGRYVSLNKKKNCQGDNCRYSLSWPIGKKFLKESGNYYLKVCYLVKNQGQTQTITCASSNPFIINVPTPATGQKTSVQNNQLANVWSLIANLLNR